LDSNLFYNYFNFKNLSKFYFFPDEIIDQKTPIKDGVLTRNMVKMKERERRVEKLLREFLQERKLRSYKKNLTKLRRFSWLNEDLKDLIENSV